MARPGGHSAGRGDDERRKANPDRRRRVQVSTGNELSRLLLVDPLADGGLDFSLQASPQERTALAKRFDLLAIEELVSSGTVVKGPLPDSVLIEGRARIAEGRVSASKRTGKGRGHQGEHSQKDGHFRTHVKFSFID